MTDKQTKFNRKSIQIGDTVKVLARTEAFYSSYAGNPTMFIEAGQTGTIGAVRVPVVRQTRPRRPFDEYVCVDFIEAQTNKLQRAAVSYNQLQIV